MLHVHGSLSKNEKFNLIKIFVSHLQIEDFNPRVLVGTSATDLGIDKSKLKRVQIYEWCEDLSTFVQRRGRASRDGELSTCSTYAGLAAYTAMIARIYREQDSGDDNAEYTIAGMNTDVTPRKKKQSKLSSKTQKKYELTDEETTKLLANELAEFSDVLDMFCFDKGCVHRRLQFYLANGTLTDVPPCVKLCGDACPICTKEWYALFMPVRKLAVYEWFDHIRDILPCKASCENLYNLLWTNTAWKTAIFDRGDTTIYKYHVESFFMMLIGAGFIEAIKASLVPYQGRFGSDLIWILSKVEGTTKLKYKMEKNWWGVHLHPIDRDWQYSIPDKFEFKE